MLIGIAGRAGNGKSTAAEAIIHHVRHKGLRAKSYEISALILAELQDHGVIPTGLSRSELSPLQVKQMMDWGKLRRLNSGTSYWTDAILDQITDDGVDLAIIPNIRHEDEARFIHRLHGHVVKVTALNQDGSPFISLDRDPNDVTETTPSLLKPDYHLTAGKGESALLGEFAVTLYEYLEALEAR